jgi:cell division protein FtsZ
MNDVNDFMAKFGEDFEIKWGLAIDPDLEKKVKVTILATGFGIEDVEPKDRISRRSQEEANRIAEEEEKAAERQDRRNRYYATDAKNTKYKRRPHIYIFNQDDLDNEDVILAVENTPTYKRTRQMLDEIRNQANGNKRDKDNDDKADTVQGVISFA